MNRFPRVPGRRGDVFIIDVTFVPDAFCLAMRDEKGTVYIWGRKDSVMIQDPDLYATLIHIVRDQPPRKVVTPSIGDGVKFPPEGVSRYASNLLRYIERGVSRDEEPMLIVMYGILYPRIDSDRQDALRDALAGVLAVAA